MPAMELAKEGNGYTRARIKSLKEKRAG